MTSMSVDGLVSGLDTTSLINQLMTAEAAPQTALKSKVTKTQSVIAAYQSLNAKFAAMQTAAAALGSASTWSTAKASASDPSVAATAGGSATAGRLDFDVTSVAKSHSSATSAFSTLADIAEQMPPVLTVTKGGQTVTLSPSDGDLSTLISTINNAVSLGLSASAVQVSPGYFRLQITSKTTGADSGFTVEGLSKDPVTQPMTTVRQGSDASIDLGGGLVVTSPTNTFTDVLPGTTFTVSALKTGVSLSVAPDTAAQADKVKAFVDAANAVGTEIARYTTFDAAGRTSGPLVGESTVRGLRQAMLDTVTNVIGAGGSAATAGVTVDRLGKISFDRAKFEALQASDPAKAQSLVQAIGARGETLGKETTNSTKGSLSLLVQGKNDLVRTLNSSISDWDDRLTLRRATLSRQFSAMEVALSGLKSQSNWLSGQISSLPSYGS